VKVNLNGLMTRAAAYLDRSEETKIYGFSIREFLGHINDASNGYYNGNTEILEEFFELYCLSPKEKKINE
jgi:hypothetical protein